MALPEYGPLTALFANHLRSHVSCELTTGGAARANANRGEGRDGKMSMKARPCASLMVLKEKIFFLF